MIVKNISKVHINETKDEIGNFRNKKKLNKM